MHVPKREITLSSGRNSTGHTTFTTVTLSATQEQASPRTGRPPARIPLTPSSPLCVGRPRHAYPADAHPAQAKDAAADSLMPQKRVLANMKRTIPQEPRQLDVRRHLAGLCPMDPPPPFQRR